MLRILFEAVTPLVCAKTLLPVDQKAQLRLERLPASEQARIGGTYRHNSGGERELCMRVLFPSVCQC